MTGSTRTIGLVTVKINQYGPAQTMLGLEKAARAAGYSLSVSILDDATAGAMRDAVDAFVAQRVDAIVALSTYDDAAEALASWIRRCRWSPSRWAATRTGRPWAWTRRPARGWPSATCSTSGTAPCTTSPDRPTRRRPAVASPAGGPSSRPWARRCREPLRGDWTPSSGYAAGRQLADRIRAGEDITAIFLANDQMALGLLAAFHEAGLETPDDVSVVGFDDLPEAPYFTPPLTTVRQDFAELGRRGVQLVLARLRGEDLHPRPVPAQLIVRASTGPAEAAALRLDP